MIARNTIGLGDCVEGMRKLPNECVDICVSSFPYKTQDGFSYELSWYVLSNICRLLKPNSLFFLNFGHLKEEKERPFKVVLQAIGHGFKLNDTIIWQKPQYRPLQGKKRLNNVSEFIFLLYKGEMPDLDRMAIGVPYDDISNAKRFSNGRNLKCRGNIWRIGYETITNKNQRPHPDLFPVELPLTCLKLADLKPGSLVLDPFMGSFTSAIAAKMLELDYIGFEHNPKYHEIGARRLNEYAHSVITSASAS